LLLLSFILASSFLYANNLIANPSFEDWDSNWNRNEINGFSEVVIDDSYAFDGRSSAKIAAVSPAEAYWEIAKPLIVEGGQAYLLSAFIKTEFIEAGDGAVASVLFEDAFGRKVSEKIILQGTGTNNWEKQSQVVEVPVGATYLTIRLGLHNASGVVYWDQVSLSADEQAIRSVLVKKEQKIDNVEGFEEGLNGWEKQDREGKLQYGIDTNVKHSGKSSAKIGSTDLNARGWLFKNFEIQGGKKYFIKAWAKADKLADKSVSWARAKLYDGSGKQYLMEGNPFCNNPFGDLNLPNLQGTSDWKLIEGWFDAPEGAQRVLIDLILQGSGTVWWDDFSIQEEGVVIPASKLSLADSFNEGLKGWNKIDREGKLEYVADDKVKRSGAYSTKLSSDNANARGWISKEFEIEGAKKYILKTWAKTEKAADFSAWLRAKLFDANGKQLQIQDNPYCNNPFGDLNFPGLLETSDWKQLEGWFVAPTGTKKLLLELILAGAGTVWWDDILIEEEGATSSEVQRLFIAGELEEGFNTWEKMDREGKLEYDLDKEIRHNGNNSIKVTSINSNTRGWIHRTFAIQGDKKYLIKVWAKTDKVSGAASPRVKLFDDGGKQFPMDGNPYCNNPWGDLNFPGLKGTIDWTEISGWFIAPAGATNLLIDLMLSGSGTVWWGNVTIEEVDEMPQGVLNQPQIIAGITAGDLLLVNPKDGDMAYINPPAFIWSRLGDNIEYTLEISGNKDFNNAKQIRVTEGSIYVPNWFFDAGTWYWRVSANVAGKKVTSKSSHFTVEDGLDKFAMPSKEELKTLIPSSHPRLFFLKEDLSQLRKSLIEESEAMWQQLLLTLDRNIGTSLLPDPEGYANNIWNADDWRRIWADGRVVRDNMINYAFGYLISGKKEYLQEAKRWMLCAASWDPNGSTSDRSNDEASRAVLEGLGIAYDWLHDEFSPQEREQLLKSIVSRGEEMHTLITKTIKMETNPYDSHGWNKVGILSQCALAIYGDHQIAETWLTHNLRLLMGRWPAWGGVDGGWAEGVYYQAPYIERFLRPASALKKAVGVDLYSHPWFKNGIYFLFYGWAPGTPGAEFGDKWPGPPEATAVMNTQRLALAKQNPYLQWYVDMAGGVLPSPNVPEGFLWTGRIEPKPPVDLPQAHAFYDVGFAVMHTNISDPGDNIVFNFKCGPYGGMSHSHADQNTFNISAFGQRLAIDSGYYDYYGSPHHYGWTRQTMAHNSILVNDQGQAERAAGTGDLTGFITSEYYDYVGGEAGVAYQGKLDRFHRQIIHLRPGYYVLADDLQGPENASYDWLLHAVNKMDVDSEHNIIKITQADARFDINFVEPAKLAFSQNNEYTADPTTPFTKEWHLKATAKAQGRGQRFLTLMNVYRDGEEKSLKVSNLTQGDTLALKLEEEQVTSIIGFNYDEKASLAELDTDAAAFAIQYKDNKPQRFFAEKGTYLSDNNNVYYRATYSSSISLGFFASGLDGTIQLAEDDLVEIYVPFQPLKLVVGGKEVPFTKNGDLVQFKCCKGQHQVLLLRKELSKVQEEEVTINVEGQGPSLFKIYSDGIHRSLGNGFFQGEAGIYQLIVEGESLGDSFNLKIGNNRIKLTPQENQNGKQILVADNLLMSHQNVITINVTGETKASSLNFKPVAFTTLQQPIAWENSPLATEKSKAILIQAEDFVGQGGGTCALTTTHKARYNKGIMNWGPVGHWLEWEFTVPSDGDYQIMLGGATTYPKVIRSFAIDGEYPVSELQMLEFSNTGGWGYELNQWANYLLGNQVGKPIKVTLKKGKHTIRMISILSWINLDYIAFIKQ
jgi:hypothetical protein